MSEVLRLEHVSKAFGKLEVIRDLSFSVSDNSVFGFIGKNGAGKTTTMKMILGFLKPDSGDVYVCGEKVVYGGTKTNRHIGYLPDVPEFYGYMRPKEYLRLCGRIAGMEPKKIKEKSKELLALVGLEKANRKIQGFSRGMKQRLGIAQALLNEPKLLICDEPTSALDPVGRKEILDILLKVSDKTTIVFSTHILSDVERVCDTVGILNDGNIALEGRLSDIKDTYRQDSVAVELAGNEHALVVKDMLLKVPSVLGADVEDRTVTAHVRGIEEAGKSILALLSQKDIPVLRYEVLEPSLENVFLEVVK